VYDLIAFSQGRGAIGPDAAEIEQQKIHTIGIIA